MIRARTQRFTLGAERSLATAFGERPASGKVIVVARRQLVGAVRFKRCCGHAVHKLMLRPGRRFTAPMRAL